MIVARRPRTRGRHAAPPGEGLDAGALGLSSGLFTAPGSFARPAELHALLGVVKQHGGAYATHIRSESDAVFDAVREAIEASEQSGVHVQIVHMKLSGLDNRGRAAQLLAAIDGARRRGVPIDCDAYPYTCAANPLRNLLPLWIQEGGLQPMLGRLRDPAVRIASPARSTSAASRASDGSPPGTGDLGTSRTRSVEPGHIAELARRAGWSPSIRLRSPERTRAHLRGVCSIDEAASMRSSLARGAVGSDGRAVAPDSGRQGRPHRGSTAVPRVLGHYARDLGLLSLPRPCTR